MDTKELCKDCAKCCKYVAIVINPPKTEKDKDRIIWYLLHNTELLIEQNGTWKIRLPQICTALDEKGLCKIYNDRPLLCREYSTDNCEKYPGKPYYIKIIRTKEEFLNYLTSCQN